MSDKFVSIAGIAQHMQSELDGILSLCTSDEPLKEIQSTIQMAKVIAIDTILDEVVIRLDIDTTKGMKVGSVILISTKDIRKD